MSDGTPFGIWALDKPSGPTSHDVVASVRRRLDRGVKVGHAGTLDPFATGLLLILVGRATRLMRYVVGHDKSYRARVRFGVTSATGDPEGPLAPTGAALPSSQQVQSAVAELTGTQTQSVPAYAAVKVDGERLYRRARRGEAVERPTRQIAIRSAEVLDLGDDGAWADIRLTCSSGTYVRQVATDLGDRLGCGAYCEALRRLAVGRLDLGSAVEPESVTARGGIDPREALAPMPERTLSDRERELVVNGRPLESRGESAPTMLLADERLIAIGEPDGADVLHPKVVLA